MKLKRFGFIMSLGFKKELIFIFLTGYFSLSTTGQTAPAITQGMIFFRTQKYLIVAGKR